MSTKGDGAKVSAEFKLDDDQQTFNGFLEVAKGAPTELSTRDQQKAFLNLYNRWVAEGRPRPKMAISSVDVTAPQEQPIPMKLYREKHMGEQYLYWRDTKGVMHEKEDDPILRRPKLLAKWNKGAASKLVKEAEDKCYNPTFYIVFADGRKVLVSPEEFLDADIDQLKRTVATSARQQ